jgi:threonine dehydrogenase-like Zn-dependent dehydrogenase
MQEYLQIPIHKLHSSGQLSYDQLALVETLAIGAHAVERAQVSNQDTILVIGAGPIGLAVTQFAKLMTDKVLVMDKHKSRLQFCQQEMQVEHTIEADANSIANLQSVMAGNLPTIVFDATGNEQSMHESFQYVSHGGKLVFVGLFQGNVSFYDPEFHKRE